MTSATNMRPRWIAFKTLVVATASLAGTLVFWGVLNGMVALAQSALAALGVLPTHALHILAQNSTQLWQEGAIVLAVLAAVLALSMACFALLQSLMAFKAWLRLDSFID